MTNQRIAQASKDICPLLRRLCGSPIFLSLCALLATVPLYSPNITELYELQYDMPVLPYIVPSLMISSIIGGVICAADVRGMMSSWFSRARFVKGISGLYVGSLVALWFLSGFAWLMPESLVPVLGGLVGCVLGLATTFYLGVWLGVLSRFAIKESLVLFSCALACAALCHLVMMQVDVILRSMLYVVLAVGSAYGAVRYSDASLSQGRGEAEDLSETGQSALNGSASEFAPGVLRVPSLLRQTAHMAQILFIPFLGLLFFAFLMGVRRFTIFNGIQVEFVSVIIACMLTLGIAAIQSHRPLLQLILYVIIPGCALVIMLGNAFPLGSVVQWFAAWFTYVFFSMVAQIAFSGLVGMAHAREFSITTLAGLTVACFSACSLVGIGSGGILLNSEDVGGPVLLVLSSTFFVVSIAGALWQLWREREPIRYPFHSDEIRSDFGDSDNQEKFERASNISQDAQIGDNLTADADSHGLERVLKETCTHIAQGYKLSPRESEVFVLMARGHSITYIASEFVLSESTVRTHAKSIYRKLGINSKEELFELVDNT